MQYMVVRCTKCGSLVSKQWLQFCQPYSPPLSLSLWFWLATKFPSSHISNYLVKSCNDRVSFSPIFCGLCCLMICQLLVKNSSRILKIFKNVNLGPKQRFFFFFLIENRAGGRGYPVTASHSGSQSGKSLFDTGCNFSYTFSILQYLSEPMSMSILSFYLFYPTGFIRTDEYVSLVFLICWSISRSIFQSCIF